MKHKFIKYLRNIGNTDLNDLNFSLNNNHNKILFQIPISHSKKIIEKIIIFSKKQESILYKKV